MCLIGTSMDCKQRNSTASKKLQLQVETSPHQRSHMLCNRSLGNGARKESMSVSTMRVDTEFPYRFFSLILCCGESVEAELSHGFWRHRGSILNFRIWGTGGILFREYCFGEENSLSSAANSVSSARNSVSSRLHTNNRPKGTH